MDLPPEGDFVDHPDQDHAHEGPKERTKIIPVIPMIPAERMSVCCICFQLAPKYRIMLISLFLSITSDRSAFITPISETMIEMNSIA